MNYEIKQKKQKKSLCETPCEFLNSSKKKKKDNLPKQWFRPKFMIEVR